MKEKCETWKAWREKVWGPLREEPLEKEAKSCRDMFYFMFNKLLNAYEDDTIKCEKSESTSCNVYEVLLLS